MMNTFKALDMTGLSLAHEEEDIIIENSHQKDVNLIGVKSRSKAKTSIFPAVKGAANF